MINLENFKNELNLEDAFKGQQIRKKWTVLDYFLYKQSEDLNFKILTATEDESFFTEEGSLSDHPALVIELSIK